MLDNRTIGDSVYELIKYDIVHLTLKPGETLSEASLAEKYGISKAPVRVALRKLQEEGLIVIRPQSGSIVSPISISRAVNIIDIRLLLEPYAAAHAVQNLTKEDLRYLEERFKLLDIMVPGSEERSQFISKVDIELHGMIQDRSGNPMIREILSRYASEIQRIRRANIEWRNRMEPSEQEMRYIFAAITQRDAEKAAEAMRIHLNNIRTALLNLPNQSE